MRSAGRAVVLALALGSSASGCRLSETERDSVRDVLTLRRGTISDLRALRLTGPFTRYEVPPGEMLLVVADAAGKARDSRGRPARRRVSPRYGEVVAKESAPEAPPDPSYDDEWSTAAVITVHPVANEPEASRVEFHAARRSVLMGGLTDWNRSLPGWIDEVLRARTEGGPGVPGAEHLPERADLSAAGSRFLAKWNDVLALRDAVPPPPVPPAERADAAAMTKYRAALASYARAADAYRTGLQEIRGVEFAHEWARIEPKPAPGTRAPTGGR